MELGTRVSTWTEEADERTDCRREAWLEKDKFHVMEVRTRLEK